MLRSILIFTSLTLFPFTSEAEETYPEELCNVMSLISSFQGKDGPLDRCREGDIVHFQIEKALVPIGAVAARYCNFDQEILVDTLPNSTISHLVCKYKWKWGKDVKMEKHPDAQ